MPHGQQKDQSKSTALYHRHDSIFESLGELNFNQMTTHIQHAHYQRGLESYKV